MILILRKSIVFLLIIAIRIDAISAQYDPYDLPCYDFLNYQQNKLDLPNDSSNFKNFFSNINTLILKGEGQINVVHIGDSHLQADYFSGEMRQRMQTFFQGGLGGRGFIFPYALAKTNNPYTFSVKYTGNWESCRNIERKKQCSLGLSGVSVTTYDSVSTISIFLRTKDYPKYDFNKVKIFHTLNNSFTVEIDSCANKRVVFNNDSLGYTYFLLDDYIDTLHLKITKTDSTQTSFTLHGISLETNDPGIIYHSIGVNGAEVNSFLRCDLFSRHLEALSPDFVIVSLGTNDAYPKKFNEDRFIQNYDTLINNIKLAVPDAAILLTVPADSYRMRKYPNTNTEIARNAIYKIATSHQCAVWDLYDIMGGFQSINKWNQNGFTASDKLHFSKSGYILQGDLLFTAFLKSYDEYIEKYITK